MRLRSSALIVVLILAACSRTAAPSASPTPSVPAGPSSSVGPSPASQTPASPQPSPASQPPESSRPPGAGPSPSSPAPAPSPCPPIAGKEDFGQLTDIRVGTHDTYDRVTFQFTPGNTSLPGPDYELRNVTSFTKDPSDEPMHVAGVSFLQLVLQGASGVDPNGTVTYRGPFEFKPAFPVLAEVELRGDFERVLSFVIGLNHHRCPTVHVLPNPPRLVVDLPH